MFYFFYLSIKYNKLCWVGFAAPWPDWFLFLRLPVLNQPWPSPLSSWMLLLSSVLLQHQVAVRNVLPSSHRHWTLLLAPKIARTKNLFPCPKARWSGLLFHKFYSSGSVRSHLHAIELGCTMCVAIHISGCANRMLIPAVLTSLPSGQLSHCQICCYKVNYSWDGVNQSRY